MALTSLPISFSLATFCYARLGLGSREPQFETMGLAEDELKALLFPRSPTRPLPPLFPFPMPNRALLSSYHIPRQGRAKR
ncbi:hypothetical protein F4811DRAFT_516941 [Daldinia bambusicola]|nr:hypothetical protein F4811DRAFT_516941 [Daldinia bambusicola]